MKTYRQIPYLLAVALLAATPAVAHHASGFVYCDQDGSNTITAGDLPLGGITVTATPTGNAGQVASNTTSAGGVYIMSLLPVTESYTVALTAGVPNGSSIVLPVGGTHTADIVSGIFEDADGLNFLLKDCTACTPGSCGDDNPCTDDVCTAQGCTHMPNTASCDDGNACTTNDVCGGGTCGGTAKTCGGADQCHTAGTCDPQTGQCSNPTKPDGAACDDHNACTLKDACTGGLCTGPAKACGDGNQCTVDACDPASGCVFINTTKPCNDGNACTISDTCSNGACTGRPRVCDDNNGCTDDTCNAQTGCAFISNKAACNDGDACTTNDVCSDGKCAPGAPLNCDDNNPCTDDACGPQGCLHTNNAASCNDHSLCTTSDVCGNGTCNGTVVSCDDQNPCTDDSCKANVGCEHANNAALCDDNNACTHNEQCTNGACHGTPTAGACDDANACTDDSCDPATGCVNTANATPCNDGNPCTQSDVCANKACVGSNPVTCPSADQCHEPGTCNRQSGACSNPVKVDGTACSDNNICTQTDSCQAGACTGANPKTCSGSDQCHDPGTCDPQSGACSNPAKADGATCSDNNVCTQNDSCQAGMCSGKNKNCAASDPCHDPGLCDPQSGVCSNPAKADGATCSDSNACTQTDTCTGGTCTGANPKVCGASDQCHEPGTCDPQSGICSNPPKPGGTPCNDNLPCTNGDQCGNGICAGTPLSCDDQNPCTADACGLDGCTHTNITGPCDDHDQCTIDDTCQNGQCVGAALPCDDGNPCNGEETCDPQTHQCIHTPLNGPPFLFCSEARLNNRATINADVGVNAVNGTLKIARDGFAADGTTMTVNDLTLANNASIDHAKVNTFFTARGAVIRGTRMTPTLPIVTPCCAIPAATCDAAATSITVQKNENHAPLTAGNPMGALSLMNNATITLMAGDYTFCDLQVAKNATINTMGAVTVNVTGDFRLGNNSEFAPKAGSPIPKLNVGGHGFRLGANASLTAVTRAPIAEGHFGRSATVNGPMCLDSAVTDKNLTLNCPQP